MQRVMTEAAFQAATPAEMFRPRKRVASIDAELRTYVTPLRTVAKAQVLLATIRAYLIGAKTASRRQVARQLEVEVDAERRVLAAIGDDQVAHLDPLLAAAGPHHVRELIAIAEHAVGADPRHLRDLIAVVGPAHLHLVNNLITDSGGVTQLGNLRGVIARHPGQGDRVVGLARAAAGDPAVFARLAGEIPFFRQAAAPMALVNVGPALQAYNDARQNSIVQAMTNLATHAEAARRASGLAASLTAKPNLFDNAGNKIAALNLRIAALAAPGAVFGLPDRAAVNEVKSIITFALDKSVTNQGLATPAFAQAVTDTTQEFGRFEGAADVPRILSVNGAHFLTRHTAHHFLFAETKDDNTLWPLAWGAQSGDNIAGHLSTVLTALAGAATWLLPTVPRPHQPLAGGGTAQVATRIPDGWPADSSELGMFFPHAQPHLGIHDHSRATMVAIERVL